MHFLINENFSRPSWGAPGRAAPATRRPSRPTGASRGLGRSLPAPGEAGGRACASGTPNLAASLGITVPGAGVRPPPSVAVKPPGCPGASPGKRRSSRARLLPPPGTGGPAAPHPRRRGFRGVGGVFWLPDGVLIKNSLRGARRSAMNISGLSLNNKVGVWGRMHRGEAAPGARLGPALRRRGRQEGPVTSVPSGPRRRPLVRSPGARCGPVVRRETAPVTPRPVPVGAGGPAGTRSSRPRGHRHSPEGPRPCPRSRVAVGLRGAPGAAERDPPCAPRAGRAAGWAQRGDPVAARDVPSEGEHHPPKGCGDRGCSPPALGRG